MGQRPRPRLPLVDPDYLLAESDPNVLRAYALGLLGVLSGELRPGRPYRKENIKAATCWLVDAYADAKLPLAPEVSLLITKLIKPKRTASTSPVRASSASAYWGAIKFEATHRPDPRGNAPSTATLYSVAKYLLDKRLLQNEWASQKTAEGTVKPWRKTEHYRSNVALWRDLSGVKS